MAVVGVIIAAIGLLVGFIFWQNNISRSDMRAEFSAEIAGMPAEINDLRMEVSVGVESPRGEVGMLRSEVGELGERLIRSEILFQDRLPSVP